MIYADLGYDFAVQLRILLYALSVGAVLGAVFDILRISRVFLTFPVKGRAARFLSETVLCTVSFIEDVLYFILCALTVVLFLFKANHGSIRGYLLFGALTGFVLYLITVGRLTRFFSKALSRALWRLIDLLTSKIIKPILRLILRGCGKIYKMTLGRLFDSISKEMRLRKTDRVEREICSFFDSSAKLRKGKQDETASILGTRKICDSGILRYPCISSCLGTGRVQRSGRRANKADRRCKKDTGRGRRASEQA